METGNTAEIGQGLQGDKEAGQGHQSIINPKIGHQIFLEVGQDLQGDTEVGQSHQIEADITPQTRNTKELPKMMIGLTKECHMINLNLYLVAL